METLTLATWSSKTLTIYSMFILLFFFFSVFVKKKEREHGHFHNFMNLAFIGVNVLCIVCKRALVD